MIGIDLFAGAGGMSLGAIQAGIEVGFAVEVDPHAAKTYQKNFPAVKLFNGDIRKLKALPVKWENEEKVLFGGPPCQGFSTSNQRTRKLSNPDNWLFEEFFRIAKMWNPDWIVFENVKGIVETEGGAFLLEVKNRLAKLGYTVSDMVLNAADFGVPQIRHRLFVVGSKSAKRFDFPKALVHRRVTVSQAIGDLPSLTNGNMTSWKKYRRKPTSAFSKAMRGALSESPNHIVTRNADYILQRYEHIPQGGNWENIPARLMKNYTDRENCHTGIYHRIELKKPSIVIGNFRKNMLIHPTENRGLSVREAARLQSFPDTFEFVGSIGFQQQQVGNAVPPLLAKAVFSALVKSSDQIATSYISETRLAV